MKKHSAKIALFALITAGLVTPILLRADDSSTNTMDSAASSDTTPAKPAKHKHAGMPFHGKLDAVDTTAMTLTVGSRTFSVTSKTKITKDGQPAELSDGVLGQPVSGFYHTNEDGGLAATSIHFGMHGKHKAPAQDMSTNAPGSN
jgi:hypothetical protein